MIVWGENDLNNWNVLNREKINWWKKLLFNIDITWDKKFIYKILEK